jgi:hypothetical protein
VLGNEEIDGALKARVLTQLLREYRKNREAHKFRTQKRYADQVITNDKGMVNNTTSNSKDTLTASKESSQK